jgi:hypothetical protein
MATDMVIFERVRTYSPGILKRILNNDNKPEYIIHDNQNTDISEPFYKNLFWFIRGNIIMIIFPHVCAHSDPRIDERRKKLREKTG